MKKGLSLCDSVRGRSAGVSSPCVVAVGHAAPSEMAAAWQRQLQMAAPASQLEGDARNVAIEPRIAALGLGSPVMVTDCPGDISS